MKINLILFVSSTKEPHGYATIMMKTFESNIRPVEGDILNDPGFHPQFHNGYEVVKVTIDYASDECWVSLTPLAIELEDIPITTYIENLQAHGWHTVSKEQFQPSLR